MPTTKATQGKTGDDESAAAIEPELDPKVDDFEKEFLLKQVEILYSQIESDERERTSLFRFAVIGSAAYWAWFFTIGSVDSFAVAAIPAAFTFLVAVRVIALRFGIDRAGKHIAKMEVAVRRREWRWESNVSISGIPFFTEGALWVLLVFGNLWMATKARDLVPEKTPMEVIIVSPKQEQSKADSDEADAPKSPVRRFR